MSNFKFIYDTDEIIIHEQLHSRDKNGNPRALAECPDCGKVRPVYRASIRQYGNTRCLACAKTGRAPAFIEDTADITIHEQSIARGSGRALAECPGCGNVRPVLRDTIKRLGHTRCPTCANKARAVFIEDTIDIIIIKQFATRSPGPKALVRCPDCGQEHLRRRGRIVTSGHTLCMQCSRSGEHNSNWRGGPYPYPSDWLEIAAHIRDRDFHTCQYPNCDITSDSEGRLLDVHHIVPLRDSQDNSEYNLVTLCQACHLWADSNLSESIPMFEYIISALYV